MASQKEINGFIKELQKKLKKEMPRIRREIKIYEEKLSKGELTKNPIPAPQFNG